MTIMINVDFSRKEQSVRSVVNGIRNEVIQLGWVFEGRQSRRHCFGDERLLGCWDFDTHWLSRVLGKEEQTVKVECWYYAQNKIKIRTK